MTAFIAYSMEIVFSFLMIASMAIFLPRAGIAADRVYEVLNTTSSITDKADAEEIGRGRWHGQIRPRVIQISGCRGKRPHGHRLCGKAGTDYGYHRVDRLRQDDAYKPHPEVLRCDRGQGHSRRPRRKRCHSAFTQRCYRIRTSEGRRRGSPAPCRISRPRGGASRRRPSGRGSGGCGR